MTEPPACLASLPVSKLSVLSPTMTSRVCIGGALLPDVQALDQIGVALRVLRLEVVEQPASAADQHQQATARVMIFRVGLEVLGEVVDALAENRNLYFGRTGVRVVCLVGANQFGLAVFGQRHGLFPPRALQSRSEPDAPYARKSLTRTSATCYTRITAGCKSPGVRAASATPMRLPCRSSNRTRGGAPPTVAWAAGGTESVPPAMSEGPRSRPWPARCAPSSVRMTGASAASTSASGTSAAIAAPRSPSAIASGTAAAIAKSPLRVR